MREYLMMIDGEWTEAVEGGTFASISPVDGKPWATLQDASPADVDKAVAAARHALEKGPWSELTGADRSRLMRTLADLIRRDVAALAETESRDNGKLLRETSGQVASLAKWLDYFAGAADKIQGHTISTDSPNYFIYTREEPVGVVAAITPWNSPLALLMWKLAPALAAGCTFVVKPAESTSASTLELAALVKEAGFPAGVFNVVTGFGTTCGRPLVRNPGVDKVAFTGSTATGIAVMKDAAEHLADVSLELGGKSPNIVFDDCDLDAAANGVIAGIFAASGQTCIAGSRLLVQRGVHDSLVAKVAERAATIRLGDPLDPETEMGPVAVPEQLRRIEEYVEIGVSEGATLRQGGRRATEGVLSDGFFFEPTIFDGVSNSMRIAREEIFGPVLSVITFGDEAEALAIANDSDFGLAAGVWTNDVRRAHRMAHKLRAGTVWVNAYRAVSYAAPFGGFKSSGIGRESGLDAVKEFTETKTVWLELSGVSRDPFTLG